jgi:hypothetical protein
LNTVLDYEVFKRFCTTLLRRESAVLSSTVSKYADITRDSTVTLLILSTRKI